jgi:hypothetical protein
VTVVHCPDCEVEWASPLKGCWICGGPATVGGIRHDGKTYVWNRNAIVPVHWAAEDLDEVVNL